MDNYLSLTDKDWQYGSYFRKDFLGDTLYTCCFYKEISFIQDGSSILIQDGFGEEMLRSGMITQAEKEAYENRVRDFFEKIECYDEWSLEQIYERVHRIRKHSMGAGAMESFQKTRALKRMRPGTRTGIDQSWEKNKLLAEKKAFLFILGAPEYYGCMEKDMETALALGKQLYAVTGGTPGDSLMTKQALKEILRDKFPVTFLETGLGWNLSQIPSERELQGCIDQDLACLFFYGEDGFFQCKDLKVPALVQAVPASFCARALAGEFEEGRFCTIYVPPHFNIYPYVRLRERSRITFKQLDYLSSAYGPEIYRKSLKELYQSYPQVFLNIYGESGGRLEDSPEFPIKVNGEIRGKDYYGSFCSLKEDSIRKFFNTISGISYVSAYMDGETMEEREIQWEGKGSPEGILVQGVIVEKAALSRVILSEHAAKSPRTVMREAKQRGAFQIVSNFLFFLTPKLAAFYNQLRIKRPREQIWFDSLHIDYMLDRTGERTMETFPLYRKACIAMRKDGTFSFFQFRLGGGTITMGGVSLRWTREGVDPEEGQNPQYGPKEKETINTQKKETVWVFTPLRSAKHEKADSENYYELVGKGRFNLVIIHKYLVCARKGEVMLPGIGVVLSVPEEMGDELLRHWKLNDLGDGYYECGNLPFSLCLDPPDGISQDAWDQVLWAYGGGMSLIKAGEGVFETETSESLRAEGWLSPLSIQTQESPIHQLEKHPRTAVGVTERGRFFVMVFSGRSSLSAGADYREMSRIARHLIPDVVEMMNVDGGGSSVLGAVFDGNFMELSYPATSYSSCAGMVRQINTMLVLSQ
ncbi:phosphodiester glycosidase family protein [Lacrimispora brassicae]